MTPTTDQHTGTAAPDAAVPASGLPDDPEKHRDTRAGIVPVLAFAGITVAVMQTLLVPVIKDLPALLGTSAGNATWVMTSTLLAGAVATPIMGRLGDLAGKRRMLLVSLAVMVVGSLICGFTDSLVIMIVGRALQGFAMGAIPLGIGLMRDELPPQRLGGAMALMSSSIGVGGGLALPAAALIAQHLEWHALFFTAAGLGVLAILLTLLLVPESAVRARGRFDLPGAAGLAAGLILLLLPITKGSDWGWAAPKTLGLFGGAVVVLVLWGVMELRLAAPLVDLRTTARREVLLTNLASIMVGVAFYAISLVLPQLLQLPASTGYGLGQSMVNAGLCVAPLGLTMMLTAPIYARLSAKYGPKVSLLLGMLIIGAGYGGGLGLMSAAWQTIVISVVVGAGIGLAYSSLPALIIGAVDPSETGAANGLNTLMRSIGTSVSSAVIGMVLARTAHVTGGVAVPTMHGFRISFLIATAAVTGGLLLALFLPSRRNAATAQSHLRAASHGTASPAATPHSVLTTTPYAASRDDTADGAAPSDGAPVARHAPRTGPAKPAGGVPVAVGGAPGDEAFLAGEAALITETALAGGTAPGGRTAVGGRTAPVGRAASVGGTASVGEGSTVSGAVVQVDGERAVTVDRTHPTGPAEAHGAVARAATAAPVAPATGRPAAPAHAGAPATGSGTVRGTAAGGFHGQVLDSTGAPTARAKVTLIDGRGRQAGAALTGPDGRYALDVDVPDGGGTYVLAARAAGHAPRAASAAHSGAGARVEVNLHLTASVPTPRTGTAPERPAPGA